MKKFKTSSLFKYIYLGVIITFFLIFYTRKEIYTYNIDGMNIIETSSIELPLLPKRIKSLDIRYKGLSFLISSSSPISILSDDNVVRTSVVTEMTIDNNQLILNLENEVVLNIRIDNNGGRFTISSTIPKVFPTIKEITLPYTLKNSLVIEESDLSYKIYNSEEEFHLKFNDFYYIDNTINRIHLLSDEDKISTLTFSPLSNSELPLAEQWYKTYQPTKDLSLNSQIEVYLNKITNGINATFNPMRLNQETKIWQYLPSRQTYTENSVIIYLAQGMKINNYSSRLARIQELQRRYPRDYTYASTPFLGNIVENGQIGSDKDMKELAETRTFIRIADERLFNTWIPDHYFEGNDLNLSLLEKGIMSGDTKNLNLKSLGITLNNLLNILDSGSNSSSVSDHIKVITDLIIEKIEWDNTGLYLIEDDGLSYLELNLRIGKLLIDASQHESSKYSKPIGEALITTYIDNSNSEGSISSSYDIKNKEYSITQIKPEDTFLLLSTNEYLPHYYQNRGIKIWTVSDSITVTKNSKETRITISYPVDNRVNINYHFLTISGIEPYQDLYFRGKLWRADKSFEKWGVGYYYSPASKLLFFMPAHTKTREEIVITY